MTEPEVLGPETMPTKEDILLKLTHVMYGLMAASLFTGGFTALVMIVLNFIKAEDARGTWLEPHFRWLRRTFWIGLVWAFFGAILFILLIGYFLLVLLAIWLIYRVAKGWLALMERKAIG